MVRLEREARDYLTGPVAKTEQELAQLSRETRNRHSQLGGQEEGTRDPAGQRRELDKENEKLNREAERVKRLIEQKDELYGLGGWWAGANAFLRDLPGIDIMPPTKIQQISLPELSINYNFKEVPRYDRCQTCHQGIERPGYDKDAKGDDDAQRLQVASVPDLRRDLQGSAWQGGARRACT